MLTGLKVSSLVRNCAFYRSELTGKWGPHGTEIKFLKFKMKYIAQRVDEKNEIIRLVMFTPRVMVIKMSKMAFLCTFCWIQQKNSPSLGNIFKCIWKVLFGPFRKWYGLCTSELPLVKFQRLKLKDFGITLFTHKFFYLSTISHEQLSPKPINHTIFCNKPIISSVCT